MPLNSKCKIIKIIKKGLEIGEQLFFFFLKPSFVDMCIENRVTPSLDDLDTMTKYAARVDAMWDHNNANN